MVSLTLYQPYLLVGLDSVGLMWASVFGYGSPWCTTRHEDSRLFGPPFGLKIEAYLTFESLMAVTTNRSPLYLREGKEMGERERRLPFPTAGARRELASTGV